ncbi:hypothetical protein L6164_008683 [Bauhinia variegata]|uniref:Uncharacterized protein n=1 Tax=Bauhinia variegata TaxID=167791 RepID=A0ACB9PH90_BAUVA|nr:hypothetical protein L6164_008683 [Bauhinia variegata]
MKTLAFFLLSILAFQTFFSTLIVTEARPLMQISEIPNDSFVKNIDNSASAGRRPGPAPPPPPIRAPPPHPGNTFKFIQDVANLLEKSLPNPLLA